MGKIQSGILGGFSGRVGTVVGSSWKTVHYMRALATSISNPRTEKQQSQRTKFALSLGFLKAITPFIRVGYKTMAQRQTEFNAAMSYIIKNAVSGSGLDLSVDYAKVLVSRGTLMPPFNASVEKSNGKLVFKWTDNTETGDAKATDVAMPLVYNKDKREAQYDTAAATRAEATAELLLPDNWADDGLEVYLEFASQNGNSVANSLHLLGSTGSGGSKPTPTPGEGGGDDDQEENPLG
ncbi:MAG: DUF6266 family protein [Bacteroides sp.]|nr:DUF6266 family protein [Bacteroides sp.]